MAEIDIHEVENALDDVLIGLKRAIEAADRISDSITNFVQELRDVMSDAERAFDELSKLED